MTKPSLLISFSEVLERKNLFGQFFASQTWKPWKAVWKSIDGHPMTNAERELFLQFTGGIEPENAKVISQLFVCKGRSSGGSRMLGAKGLHSCIFCDWRPYLAPGGIATSLILAADKRQAQETFSYAEGIVDEVPMIRKMVVRRTSEIIEFNNRTRIEVRVSNFRKVRGYSLCFAGLDELAFWQDASTGANPARQVYNALLPALGRLPGSFLMAISTPWSASGFFGEMIRKHYGKVA